MDSNMFLRGGEGEKVDIHLLGKEGDEDRTPLIRFKDSDRGESNIFLDSIEQVEMVGSAIARFLKHKNKIEMDLVKEDEADKS